MRTTLTLLVTSAALLGAAPAALADTIVSLEHGSFGPNLSGDYVWVTDKFSVITDKRMEVVVSYSSTGEIKVTDAVGTVHAKGTGCRESGAAVFCNPNGVEGIKLQGGVQNDVLANQTDLVANIIGDEGDDVLEGGDADEAFNGQWGDDLMYGGDGEDRFFHEPGNDLMSGQGGTDTALYTSAPSAVDVTLIDDVQFDDGIAGEPDRIVGVEDLYGSAYDDRLFGTDGANLILGRAGNDTIRALAGDDLIDGEQGGDDIGGGGNFDTVTYEDRTAAVTVTLNSIAGDGQANENDNVRHDIENLEGGSGPDTFTAQADLVKKNTLNGNGGADTLNGAAGNDEVNGGTGDDTIIGDVGSDSYDGGGGTDVLDYSNRSGEFTEDVAVTLSNSDDLDDGGASDGPAGARDNARNMEGAKTGDGNDSVTGDTSSGTISTGRGNDTVTSFAGADTITSGPVALLAGVTDDDIIEAGSGNDTIVSGAGADTITGDAGRDAVDAGFGNDTLQLADGEQDEPVKCGGPGDADQAFVDHPFDFSTALGQAQLGDCESVTIVP
jgi:Ca2+-binding RTX toxin-like protein